MLSLSDKNQADVIGAFNSTGRSRDCEFDPGQVPYFRGE